MLTISIFIIDLRETCCCTSLIPLIQEFAHSITALSHLGFCMERKEYGKAEKGLSQIKR